MQIGPDWRTGKPGPFTLNLFLVIGSAVAVWSSYPWLAYRLFAAMGTMSLLCLVLNTGWTPAMVVVGVYSGLFLDTGIKSGPIDAQVIETCVTIFVSAVVGLAVGFFIEIQSEAGCSDNGPGSSDSVDEDRDR